MQTLHAPGRFARAARELCATRATGVISHLGRGRGVVDKCAKSSCDEHVRSVAF